MKVVPALLSLGEADYREKLRLVASFTNYVQIDFMDGLFVPSRSIDAAAAAGIPVPIGYEAHLMAVDPTVWIEKLPRANLRRVIFHGEALANAIGTAEHIKETGISPGLALNPETSPEKVLHLLPWVETVLVMSVNPGFYGSPFLPEVLGKAAVIRKAFPTMVLGLDGGVSGENLGLARDAGFDYACVGSRIFQAPDPAASFARLVEAAR